MKTSIALLLFVLSAIAKDSCLECHSALDGNLKTPAVRFKNDIHAQAGFQCTDCHGGDRTAGDPEQAMSKAKGFAGHVARTAIPKLCARCHSDAAVMKKFKPQQRVDQLAQYLTSVHGKRLAAGDESVATCIDCHSVHDIRAVKDALSPVYPLRLPETCGRCHADASHMAGHKLDTTQLAQYRASVHWDALSKGDLSAPTCASCHGNHGATPPQVTSVAAVCGTCHALLEQLYSKSPHQSAFASMGLGSCTVCHSNHEIKKPSIKMLAGEGAVCSQCHDASSAGGSAAVEIAGLISGLSTALDKSDLTLTRARNSGMEVSEAQLRQMEARESLVKARVAVHAFQVAAVKKPVDEGFAMAAETQRAGESALKERDTRRAGLGVALISILLAMTGLWLAIRSLEAKPPESEKSIGR